MSKKKSYEGEWEIWIEYDVELVPKKLTLYDFLS